MLLFKFLLGYNIPQKYKLLQSFTRGQKYTKILIHLTMAFATYSHKTKIKKSKSLARRLSLSILVLFILSPVFADARTFDPNNIITDQELFNKNSLSKTAIQKFLERENSVLSRYSQVVNGRTLTGAEIIFEISQRWGINPKFLLTNLEKEQGLISKSQATEKALDWAMGYSCFNGGCDEKHRGLYNQLDAAAETQLIYVQKSSQWQFRPGVTTVTNDGYAVTPANQATANLYVYTPHVGNAPELGIIKPYGANKLFWRIWQRYFSNQKYLDGQVVKHNGEYYLIKDNQKRKFASQEIFLADYQESDAINASAKDLGAYPTGANIEFPNNTLVRSASTGYAYLLTDLTKRPLADDSALAMLSDFRLAVSASEIPEVSEVKLAGYKPGSFISNTTVFPQGKLFKDPSGQIWLIQDGAKKKVETQIWQEKFNSAFAESISQGVIDAYAEGDDVKLDDGTFVVNGGKYYLISQGARMRIDDLSIFDRIFGVDKKNNALQVSTATLLAHDAGETIDYVDDTIVDPITPTSPTTPTVTTGFGGSFASMDPSSLLMVGGQEEFVTIGFKNTGSATWNNNNVYIKTTDRDADTNSFGAPEKVYLNESSVTTGQVGTFTIRLTAPTDQIGIITEDFSLYNSSGTKITSIGKFIIIRSGDSAQIVEHNLPVAVRNTWKPIDVTMKIKNTSEDITWLSRRTALEVYNSDGTSSIFYDPNDWVREEVAAVPINASYIKPGEVGEFKFTIDPRNIKPNTYILGFRLRLLDKDKDIYLNGRDEWRREIRVD